MLDQLAPWLLAPMSGREEHHLVNWAAWHGRFMVLGWGVLIPVGILVARYWKVTPGQNWPQELDNPFWWRTHLFCQIGGMTSALIGLAIVYFSSSGEWGSLARWHGLLGWTVMALGALQVLSGVSRGSKGGPHLGPGDHYDMTGRRLIFEYFHKYGGHLTVLLAVITIVLGLITADAPRWMPVVIGGWWTLLLGGAVVLQIQGRCIDTYQAIWGPELHHPGSRSRLIGLGVRRVDNTQSGKGTRK